MRLRIFRGVTLHWGSKDGGPESHVYMYGVECKSVASALLLCFDNGSREAFHSHAFNAISAVLGPGRLREYLATGGFSNLYTPGRIVATPRSCCHKVVSVGRTWVLSLRGPWAERWSEVLPDGRTVVLGHGRTVH